MAEGPPRPAAEWSHARALLFLAVLNTAAHFLPPERAALAPDDYAYLVRVRGTTLADLPRLVAENPRLPLSEAFLVLQAWIVDDDPWRGLLLLWTSSALFLGVCYAFFVAVLEDRPTALLCAAVYCLLPYKLETYHTPIYVNIDVGCALYLASALLFIRAAKRGRPGLAAASIAVYACGVFWYEVGILLPLALWGWTRLDGRRLAWRGAWPLFGAVAAGYGAYRALVGPGAWSERAVLGLSARPLADLFHRHAGALFVLDVANGAGNFFRIDRPWLMAALLLDAWLVWTLVRVASDGPRKASPPGLLAWSAAWFALSLLPFFARSGGGVAGRHLMLPSVALALVLGTPAMRRPPRRVLRGTLVAAALVIAQGTAWTQVVACRINAAVYDAVRRSGVAGAQAVVFDLSSFTENIHSNWMRLDFDLMSSYYGAQVFADWGLSSMVHLAAGHDRTPVFFAATHPARGAPDTLRFLAARRNGSRSSFATTPVTIPARGAVIIAFADAFGDRHAP